MAELSLIRSHLALTASLFMRYGAVLTALTAAGMLLGHLFLLAAVEIGMVNRLAGLVSLSAMILLNLLVMVGSLLILRQGLPHWRLRRRRAYVAQRDADRSQPDQGVPFATALLAVLLPFYGYYAGWGMLGDVLRSYSQKFYEAQMRRVDFTQGPVASAFEIGSAGWIFVAVAVIWLIRHLAKRLQDKSESSFWPLVIVCCEATWALLGLYVLSGWKDQFAEWLATLPTPAEIWSYIIPAAAAQSVTDASIRPVDWPPEFELRAFVNRLFWYALLPLIWFNLAAIVYGHNLSQEEGTRVHQAAGAVRQRWQTLPKPITDFIGYFWAGVVKRWYAVTNGVLLASSAGVAVTLSVIVLWRLANWAGNWAWIGLAHLIGPHDAVIWQVASLPLNVMFNAPGGPSGGLLVAPLQFCILAAGLDLVRQSKDAAAARQEAVA